MSRPVVALVFLAGVASQPKLPELREANRIDCAACAMIFKNLNQYINHTKTQLEPTRKARMAADEKAIKPQTKRWLKNEYGAAIRAAAEEGAESVCGFPDFAKSTRALREACTSFADSHYDDIPRVAIDETHFQYCGQAVPGCVGPNVLKAVESVELTAKSEEVPAVDKSYVGPSGAVKRLVGKSFPGFISSMSESDSAKLVMLFSSDPKKSSKKVASEFPQITNGFYALAKNLSSISNFRLAQIDTRLNGVPLEISIPSTTHFQLWIGSRSQPVFLPVEGSGLLGASSTKEQVYEMLVEGLLSNLPDKILQPVRRALGHFMKSEEELGEKASGEAYKPRRQHKDSEASPTRKLRLQQECEMCGLIATDLHKAHEESQKKYALTKSAAKKKMKRMQGVQKAQTRRWLEAEYGTLLAGALEDRLENICIQRRLAPLACSVNTFVTLDGIFAMGSVLRLGRKEFGDIDHENFDNETCTLRVNERCAAAVEEYADGVTRGILDGLDAQVCTTIVPGCNVSTAQMFNSSYMHEQAELKRVDEKKAKEEAAKPENVYASFVGGLGGASLADLAGLHDEL